MTSSPSPPRLGFIGLGAMGGRMACRLVRAGYPLLGFDINPERLDACAQAGALKAGSAREVVERADVVLTSLRSSEIFVEVAEAELLPRARPGQTFIDLGTTAAPQARRLGARFVAQGAALLEAPVSGGTEGAETGTLRLFVGGDPEVAERCRPILEVLGDPERVVYCGPQGAGQVVKGVNQLAMGLGVAACLEAIAFGVRAGVDPRAIEQAVGGGGEPWRQSFGSAAHAVRTGRAEGLYVKFPEFPYFLAEAAHQGASLPLTRALQAFLQAAERWGEDNMGRPEPPLWPALLREEGEAHTG